MLAVAALVAQEAVEVLVVDVAAEAALEADPADPTSGLKNDVDLAQGERNDASGNFDVKFAAAAAAVIVVNGKGKMSVPVGPYKAAYVLADENPEQLALVVQFDAPEAYEYAPPS